MATIGNLVVNIQARTAKFMQGMNKATSKMKRFGASARKIGNSVGKSFLTLCALSGVALAAIV